jgi:hypothetical protein
VLSGSVVDDGVTASLIVTWSKTIDIVIRQP